MCVCMCVCLEALQKLRQTQYNTYNWAIVCNIVSTSRKNALFPKMCLNIIFPYFETSVTPDFPYWLLGEIRS